MEKIRIIFKEQRDMAEQYQKRAEAEGLSLSAWLRLQARRGLSSVPSLPTSEQCPKSDERVAA